MYCSKCKIKVSGNYPVCPLCNQVLSDGEEEIATNAFPSKPIMYKNTIQKFKQIYYFCALNVMLISFVLNVFIFKSTWWSAVLFGVLVYAYVLVKSTIMSDSNVAKKTFQQAIIIAVICHIVEEVFNLPAFTIEYALPLITAVSSILLGVMAFAKSAQIREFLIYFFCLAIMGVVPIFISWILHSPLSWAPLCSALLSATIVISLLCFAYKELAMEIKKFFHM